MATKEVTLKVENIWMDGLETACLHIQSPSGKTIVISKIELSEEQNFGTKLILFLMLRK